MKRFESDLVARIEKRGQLGEKFMSGNLTDEHKTQCAEENF